MSITSSRIRSNNEKELLGACSEINISSLGYDNEQVAKGIINQLTTAPYVYWSALASNTSNLLAKEILQDYPGDLSYKTFFTMAANPQKQPLRWPRSLERKR